MKSYIYIINAHIFQQLILKIFLSQGRVIKTQYPPWVLGIAVVMILAGVLPIPVVFILRRFQCLAFDVDIHQGSIRRIETTVSTKEMMSDQDVSRPFLYKVSKGRLGDQQLVY